jgi:4-hydroxy-2-oxoheptanedioate aldolase
MRREAGVSEAEPMRINTLKQKLHDGRAVFGAMITFPAAPVVEMLGYMGFDWVLIDNEHGSIDVDASEHMIRAAELTGVAPIVRPVANRPEVIAPFLDRGAWGVQIPHVNNRQEAEAAVRSSKYYPQGERGLYSAGRPGEYGLAGSVQDYVEKANDNTLVCLMLEEVEAIDNIPEIAAVPGVDVLFIGASDLAQSMGYPGQPTHAQVQAVIDAGVKLICDSGIVAGVSCPNSLVPKFLGLGVRYFHGNVANLLCSAGTAYLEEMRQHAID